MRSSSRDWPQVVGSRSQDFARMPAAGGNEIAAAHWQIVPNSLGHMMSSGDPASSQRVMQALMQMDKLEANELQRAFDAK